MARFAARVLTQSSQLELAREGCTLKDAKGLFGIDMVRPESHAKDRNQERSVPKRGVGSINCA